MTSTKRQKELARARAQRQAERRHAGRRQQRNQRLAIIGTLIGVLALVGVIALFAAGGKKAVSSALPSATPTAAAQGTACNGATPPPPKALHFTKEPPLTVAAAKHYTMTLSTSCGPIVFTMDAAKAPHTTNALAFLASQQYYDGTFCHRMTTSPSLTVLQCGDPTGTGAGGPGFTLPEENLTGATYARGFVAMAKTSAPHSTGSQFFLIDKDSQLPPQYTILGRMTAASLLVLDRVIAIGTTSAGDGPPNQKVYIETARVTIG